MKNMKQFCVLLCSIYALSFGVGCVHAQDSVSDDITEGDYQYSQAELDQILAPIALYPDSLLSHVLIASTYPLEVIQAQRWSEENGRPEGNEALDAAESNGWDASVLALTAFPEVLERMSEDLSWMQSVGDAFLQDEEQVLASVQGLRSRAQDQGSLSDLEHIEVIEDEDANIVIESREKEVVYVPYYDTRVVFGPWWWPSYHPVYWGTGLNFYWGPRRFVGTSIYFSSFHWRSRHVVVVDRYKYRNRFSSGRYVARHADSRRWVHNATHRRGVHYRSAAVRQRYDNRGQRNIQQRTRTNAESVGRRLNQQRSNNGNNRSERSNRNAVRSSDSRENRNTNNSRQSRSDNDNARRSDNNRSGNDRSSRNRDSADRNESSRNTNSRNTNNRNRDNQAQRTRSSESSFSRRSADSSRRSSGQSARSAQSTRVSRSSNQNRRSSNDQRHSR